MRSPPPLDGMFDGRGISYLTGFVSAVAAILTGWIYSCILPSRQTIVVDTAQGFFNLLFAAWYIVMGIAIATVLLPEKEWEELGLVA